MEFRGIHIPFTKKEEVAVAPTETESDRIARIKNQHLADVDANTRTQSGSGAGSFTPVNAPSNAGTGESTYTGLARGGNVPTRETTGTKAL